MDTTKVRIDKWLWAVRIYKTRSQATDACNKGRITIDDVDVKPSRQIKIQNIVFVSKPPVTYKFQVLNITDKRIPAKLVPSFYRDLTDPSEKEKLTNRKQAYIIHDKGAGRPTKKNRRLLNKIWINNTE